MIREDLLSELSRLLSIDGLVEKRIYGCRQGIASESGWPQQDAGTELGDTLHAEVLSDIVRDAEDRDTMTESLVGDDIAAMADDES